MADTSSINVSTSRWVKNSPYVTLVITSTSSTGSTCGYSWSLIYHAKFGGVHTSNTRSYAVKISNSSTTLVDTRGNYSLGYVEDDANGNGHTIANGTFTVGRAHSNQSFTCYASFDFSNINWSGVIGSKKEVTSKIAIDAKLSYTVTYNLAGGVGTFNNQTKWHDEPLSLYSAKPSRTGYNCLGWFVNNAGSAVDTYESNSAATIYAKWNQSLQKPTITNLVVKRCTQTGNIDEVNGTYAKASFNWSIDSNCSLVSLTVGGFAQQIPTTSHVETGPLGGSFLTDHSYDINVVITDSAGQRLTVTGTLSSSKYPIDVRAGGDGVAIGGVAETPGFRVLMPFTPIHEYTQTDIEGMITNANYFRAVHPDNRAVLCKLASNICLVSVTLYTNNTIPRGYMEFINLPTNMEPLQNGALFAESATNPDVNIIAYARRSSSEHPQSQIMLRFASDLTINQSKTTEVTVFGFYFTDDNPT